MSFPMKYRMLMSTRRMKLLILLSYVPNLLFLSTESIAVRVGEKIGAVRDHLRARCLIAGFTGLEITRVSSIFY